MQLSGDDTAFFIFSAVCPTCSERPRYGAGLIEIVIKGL